MRYTCLPLDTPTEPTRTLPWTPRFYTPGEWPLATSPVSMTSTSRLSRALGLPTAVKTLHIHDATDYGEASPLAMADFSSSPIASSPRDSSSSSSDTCAATSI